MHEKILKDFHKDNNLSRILKKYSLSPQEFLKIKRTNTSLLQTLNNTTPQKSSKETFNISNEKEVLKYLHTCSTYKTANAFNIPEEEIKKLCRKHNINIKKHNASIYYYELLPVINGKCIKEYCIETNQPLQKILKIFNFIDPYLCRTHYNKFKKKVIREIRANKYTVNEAAEFFGLSPITIRKYFTYFKTTYNKYVFEDYYYPKVLEYMQNNHMFLTPACKIFDIYPTSFKIYLNKIDFNYKEFTKTVTKNKHQYYLSTMVENEWNFATTARHFDININTLMLNANILNFNYQQYRRELISNKLKKYEHCTNSELAKKINVSLNTVVNWKNKLK